MFFKGKDVFILKVFKQVGYADQLRYIEPVLYRSQCSFSWTEKALCRPAESFLSVFYPVVEPVVLNR
jgi:hypothetical protein